jgi:hypothetical protein
MGVGGILRFVYFCLRVVPDASYGRIRGLFAVRSVSALCYSQTKKTKNSPIRKNPKSTIRQ